MAAALLLCVAGEPSHPAGSTLSMETEHLTVRATLQPDVVRDGTRMTVAVDVVPREGMHVYAPGSQYRPIGVTLDAHPALTPSAPVYPTPAVYLFKPLNEEVLAYSEPFRIALGVDVGAIGPNTSRLRVSGVLTYQACDDRVCYLPDSLPLEWTVRTIGSFRDVTP